MSIGVRQKNKIVAALGVFGLLGIALLALVTYQQTLADRALALTGITLNNGTTSLDGDDDLTSQAVGLAPDIGAYNWTVNANRLMVLNMPFNSNVLNQNDFSGGGNLGTITGATPTTSGCQVGSCMSFDGNDYIGIPNSPDWNFTDTITISLWANRTVNNPMAALGVGASNYTSLIWLSGDGTFDSAGIYIHTSSSTEYSVGCTTAFGAMWNGSWQHVVGVYNRSLPSNQLRFYVNGVLCNSTTVANEALLGVGGFGVDIGRWPQSTSYLTGKLDEVQIYNGALSEAQITQLYQDGLAGVGGPTVIQAEETDPTEVWDLDVTAIATNGTIGATVGSSNTVTIATVGNFGLNGGTTTLSTLSNLTADVTGLTAAQGAYTWTINGSGMSNLNLPFNSGATQIDYSGNAVNATVTNATYLTAASGQCKVGGCFSLDGTGDRINTGQLFSTLMTGSYGTMSVWVRLTGATTVAAVSYGGQPIVTETGGYYGLYRTSIGGQDRIWLYNWDSNEDRVGVPYTVGVWTHIVAVHGGGDIMLYQDGVLAAQTTSAVTGFLGGTVQVGAAGATMTGQVDELQVYDYALSPAQIAQLYADNNAGLTGPTVIVGDETVGGQVWDLDVTPFAADGTAFTTVSASNTVTIDVPATTVGLNNGTTPMATTDPLTSQVTALTDDGAAYTWTKSGTPFMRLNLPFNAGATQYNYSGVGVNGTVVNSAFSAESQGDCQVGGCMSFDGLNTYVEINRLQSDLMTASDGTMSVWVRPTGTAPVVANVYGGDVIIGDSSYVGLYRATISGQDRIWAYNWDVNEDRVGTTYTNDVWTHIAWVHGGGRLSIYKNGVFVASVLSGNNGNMAANVDVGRGGGNTAFEGLLDEVQIFNVALSAAQIAQLYTDGAAQVAGPTSIVAAETTAADIWDLDVTPFDSHGSLLPLVASANTVTISAPSPSVQLNAGVTSLSTDQDLEAQVVTLGDAQGAYTWTKGGTPLMSLNIPFNNGATQYNYSGAGVNGTISGSAFSAQGQGLCQIGGCMSFDGLNSFVDLNRLQSDLITASAGTMSVWVRPVGTAPASANVYGGDVIIGDSSYVGIYRTNISGQDRIWAYNWDVNEDRIGTTYTNDVWTHIVWVHGSGRLWLYKDGALVGTTLSGDNGNMAANVDVGRGGSGTGFEGLLDEVQVFNYQVSSAQIAQLYTDGAAHLTGPSTITDGETTSGEIWDLDVAPFEGDGSVFASIPSTNTVTITTPAVTVGLNNGDTLVSSYEDITSQVTGFGNPQGAYTWTINAVDYMTLNIPFNSGATQFNYSGSGINATATATAFSSQGNGLCQVGGCMSFDGVSSEVATGQTLGTLISASSGAMSMWVRPAGAGPSDLASYGGAGLIAHGYAGLFQTNISGQDRLWAYNWDLDEDRVGATYTVDVWTHLVWLHENGQLSLYKDGVLVGSVASAATGELSGIVFIGGGAGASFNGLLDEVQMFNVALSADEIMRLYTDGLANHTAPTIIPSSATEPGQTWDVSVIPFEGNGSVFSPVASANTVTIEQPTVTVVLNNGVSYLADADPLVAQVTGLGTPQGAYTWSVDANPLMALNMPFNAGGTQTDYSGNTNDGTATNGAVFTASGCKVGGCMSFDGVDDFVNVPHSTSLHNVSSYTWSAWVNPTTISGSPVILEKGTSIVNYIGLEILADGSLCAWFDVNTCVVTSAPGLITAGVHTHTVVVFDDVGNQMLLYVNGVEVADVTQNDAPNGNADPLKIGRSVFGLFFPGTIDEVQVYQRALSPDQVAQLYTDGNANVAGPTEIVADETVLGQVWDLDVTPFESDGSTYTTEPSSNTVTILNNDAPTAPTNLFTHSTDAQLGNTVAEGIDGSPVFSARFQDPNTGDTASKYRLQVASDVGFSTLLWDSGASGTVIASCAINDRCANIAYAGAALTLNATTYYWRIKFWDVYEAEGAYSATATFVTDQAPTAPTTLFTNDSNAQSGLTNPIGILAGNPVFSAIFNDPDAVDTATKYRIQVDDSSSFTSPVWDNGALGTNMPSCNQGSRCSDIVYGGTAIPRDESTYFWRIKFFDAAGVESPWSQDPVSTNFFTMGLAGGGTSIQVTQQQQLAPQPTPPDAPLAGAPEIVDAQTVRWNWIDVSANELGFRVLNQDGQIVADVSAGQAFALEAFLSPNTPIVGRTVLAYNDIGQSVAVPLPSITTPAPVARPVLSVRGGDSVSFIIEPAFETFVGETAIRFDLLITNAEGETRTVTSDWVTENSFTFAGVLPEDVVQARIVTRNQEGLQNEPSIYEDVGSLSRRFVVNLGVFKKGTEVLPRPIHALDTIAVRMNLQSVGTDPASSVTVNLPLPRYIRYVPGSLIVDGFGNGDTNDGSGSLANQNGVSASWSTVNPGESHTVLFELAFDVEELQELRETIVTAAANPLIHLQASVSFAESDAVYMSPVITLEPDVETAVEPIVEDVPMEELPVEETPVQVPTQEETQIIEEILQQEFPQPTPTPQPSPAPTLQTGQTVSDSDGGSFNLNVTGTDTKLGLTGSANVSGESILFAGTTTEPFTVITLIFNDSITAIAVSDANGVWQTFVDADRLGILPGQQASVKIEAIAAKGDLRSERVSVGDVVVSRGRTGDIAAEFDTTVSDSPVITVLQEVEQQVVKVVEEQEQVIKATLTVSAPVVIVSSAPLWGYLPYVPTLIYHLIGWLIGAVGRKKKDQDHPTYGVVYDAITKSPLALAIVRIYNNADNKLASTIVTDKLGRYDALLAPGSYRLEVSKPQYQYPSGIVTNVSDQFTVTEQGFHLPQVPIDPVNVKRQWQVTFGIRKVWLVFQRLGGYLATPIMIVGLLSSLALVYAVPDKPSNWIIVGLYSFTLAAQFKLKPKLIKAWGVVYDVASNAILPLVTIQLIEPSTSKVVTSRLSDYEGRFTFLPEPGSYVVKASKPGFTQVTEVVQSPFADRQPLPPTINIKKPSERVSGDVAMKQGV